jgi:hypothetical protein
MERFTWTIAYRKPTANRWLRVTNWAGSWAQAVGMAQLFAEANPGVQVYYTSSREAELAGGVVAEDIGNILSETTGRRVRIVEGGELPADMIARIPAADVARNRWIDRKPIADPAVTEEAAHVEALAICAGIPIDGRPAAVTELLTAAELLTDAHEHLLLVRRARALYDATPRQAPAACLHAGCHPGRCAWRVTDAGRNVLTAAGR